MAVKALEGFAFHLAKEIVFAGSDVVDEMLRQRFLLGERLGLANCALCDLDIATALGGDRAHQSGSVIFQLFLHHVVDLAAGA